MTPQEIRTAILANPELRSAIEIGNDQFVAKELARVQPKDRKELRLNELQLLELYTPAKYADALSVLAAFRTSVIPLAVILTKFMQPSTTLAPDFGLASIRNLLTDVAPSGFALTNAVVKPIIDATLVESRVTQNEISDAVLVWRPNGKSGPIPPGAT
jgi:hypothetical protein